MNGMLSAQLGGVRDIDYIVPAGRRLTEYEAVTCYTQPGPHGGGLQACGDIVLRGDGRPIFDPAGTVLRCPDWYAFRDPNQTWQRPYFAMQSEVEKNLDRVSSTALANGVAGNMDPGWARAGLLGGYLPLAHLEYGLFRALNVAAREALSDTITTGLLFAAADKLRHAQGIVVLGLDLESVLDGFDASSGRTHWLSTPHWQPSRRVVELAWATTDWVEIVVAVFAAIEPWIVEPLRRLVFTLTAAGRRDILSPALAGSASADWLRNSRCACAFLTFLAAADDANLPLLRVRENHWRSQAQEAAHALFQWLELELEEPGLAAAARRVGATESTRVFPDELRGTNR